MKVLVLCEFSGRVRDACAALGHDAWSCDLLPTEAPGQHLQMDALVAARLAPWDLVVAHPPCTHLAVSGARHFAEKRADGRQQQGIDFFMEIARLPVPRLAIENPIGIMSRVWRKPDQIVQPWQFGDPYTKATCWWLKGLPLLVPTNIVDGREPQAWLTPGGKNQWKLRSLTYPGMARAIAAQWTS